MESQEGVDVTIDIGKALSIEGWMEPDELSFLAEQAQRHKVIIELGSFLGRSTRALADNTHGIVLAVDHWKGPNDVEVAGREHLLEQFMTNLEDRIASGTVTPWNIDHREITADLIRHQLNGEQPDMIFIDGDHSYKAVHSDISNWLPFLKPGGLICGHDYNFGYPGLLRAVLELIPSPQPAPCTTIWFWEVK